MIAASSGFAKGRGQGSRRDAVATVARHPANILAARPATTVSVSGPRRGSVDQSDRATRRLPLGGEGGGAEQAGDAAYAAPQLRDASSGERRRHPGHPGAARPRQPVLDGALHPGCFAYDPDDAEPARPPVGGGDAAGIGAWPVPCAGPRGRRWRSPTFYTVMVPPTPAPMRAVLAVSRSG